MSNDDKKPLIDLDNILGEDKDLHVRSTSSDKEDHQTEKLNMDLYKGFGKESDGVSLILYGRTDDDYIYVDSPPILFATKDEAEEWLSNHQDQITSLSYQMPKSKHEFFLTMDEDTLVH